MVVSCFAVYVLTNNTQVVPYFESQAAIHDDNNYGTTRVLFASTYTARQLKTMYYSHSYCIKVW